MSALKLVSKEVSEMEVATIATSAVLIELNISSWTGRKRDRKTTGEVIIAQNAGSSKAASVIKNLMSDDTDLDAIKAYAQDTRLYVSKNTLPWGDSGTRLLPSAMIFEVTSELEARATEYDKRVAKFVADYSVKVSAAAFKLGSLFKREEYPSADAVARKFRMGFLLSPVPMSGDFRVDVQNDTSNFLKEQFEKSANLRVVESMREPWERAYETLKHAKERMDAVLSYAPDEGNPDGRRTPKLFQSTIDNAMDMALTLDKLNITKDPQLSDCAARIRRLFSNVDIKSLRESKDQQESVKKQVEEIIGMFDFGNLGE
jgi:hypothetical protein